MLHFISGIILGIGLTCVAGLLMNWKEAQDAKNELMEAELQALRNAMLGLDEIDEEVETAVKAPKAED